MDYLKLWRFLQGFKGLEQREVEEAGPQPPGSGPVSTLPVFLLDIFCFIFYSSLKKGNRNRSFWKHGSKMGSQSEFSILFDSAPTTSQFWKYFDF